MISVSFQGKPFNITVIQVYVLTNNTEEAEIERFYEDLQDLLELTPKEKKKKAYYLETDKLKFKKKYSRKRKDGVVSGK